MLNWWYECGRCGVKLSMPGEEAAMRRCLAECGEAVRADIERVGRVAYREEGLRIGEEERKRKRR